MSESNSDLYARLRRDGEIVLAGADKGRVSSLRAHAAKDGLAISQFTRRSPYRARARHDDPVSVALVHPARRTEIVRPDAPTSP